MLHLSLTARLSVLFVAGLLTIWLMMIGLAYMIFDERIDDTFPPPERLAAIVRIVETAPAGDRPLLLQALGSGALDIALEPAASLHDLPDQGREISDVVRSQYESALGGRPFALAALPRGRLQERFPWLFGSTIHAVQFRIALSSGDVLVVETRSAAVLTRFGLPIGFGAGLVGTLIALIALLIMHRETRPLRRLALAADRIDLTGEPVLLASPRSSAPEIRSLVEAFNGLQTRLSQLMRARMAMLAGISHDVRTFATKLRLRLDRLPEGVERERAVQDIADMIGLLDDALLASRAGAAELSEEMVEFDALLAAEVDDRRAEGARIDVSVAPGARDTTVLGDRVALRRIIFNLIDNALKYGYAAHLALHREANDVVLTVDDEGTGIPPEARGIVTEPFVRLETSRNRATGGAGLGLAVVRSLVDAHRGSLTLGNAPTGGARFRLTLPVFDVATAD